jgi:hypothetical protein
MAKSTQQKLIAKLDKVFSEWVRYSNAPNGYCTCCTCKALHPPEDMDAGHYISRETKATRWDERNVHPQCRSCNRFKEGKKDEYALFLIKKYGEGILEELNQLKWKPFRLDDLWLMGQVEYYKEKLKEI